jgi:hypothetical protein
MLEMDKKVKLVVALNDSKSSFLALDRAVSHCLSLRV